ncbi:MAG TPA: rhodanese-like domain-containing protein [Stenotrophomonas sp.]|jgi:rhodanese-related sulfurtransferase
MSNAVTEVSPALPEAAITHFQSQFAFETDCWDTHQALASGAPGFVLLDVRGPDLFVRGHVPGALNLPHAKIIGSRLQAWAEGTLFVVYCAGPHCNGAARAAVRLARLGRPVKLMAGGITGWIDEGFPLQVGAGTEGTVASAGVSAR